MSRLRHGLVALGVAAAAWLLPGEALASAPTSKPPASKAKSSEQDTKKARALLDKAKARIKSRQLDEASKLTQQCIDTAPGYAECYLRHGVVLAMKGDADTAAKNYRRFLELDPDSPEASRVRKLLEQYDAQR